MEKVIASITVAPDGFLWYKGAKLQVRLVNGGLEFHEKDPRRAQLCGGGWFVVPFEAFLEILSSYQDKSIGKEEG